MNDHRLYSGKWTLPKVESPKPKKKKKKIVKKVTTVPPVQLFQFNYEESSAYHSMTSPIWEPYR